MVEASPVRLFQRALDRGAENPLWVSGGCASTAGAELAFGQPDLLALRSELGGLLRRLRGLRVALHIRRQDHLATALVLLDGVADAMLLLPSDLESSECRTLLTQFEPQATLRDGSNENVSGSESLEDVVTIRVDDSGWTPAAGVVLDETGGSELKTEGGTAVEPLNTRWVMATSGTTATPKLVAHTLDGLTRTTRTAQSGKANVDYQWSNIPVWGLLYSLERFAGLQVFFQSLFSGATLLIPALEASLSERFEFLRQHDCAALSATPSLFRQLLASTHGRELPLRQITLGGEIADQAVLSALARQFPDARLVHIYASTEAGVGFSVADGRAGFPVELLNAGPKGMELKIESDRLWLRSASAKQQFWRSADPGSQPAAAATTEELTDESGWIDSGDVVEQRNGRVYFLGRAVGAINVGGSKVMPEEVEAVILTVPGVAECVVRGRPSGWVGNLVEALVVPEETCTELAELALQIKRTCAGTLPKFKIPALIKVVDSVELAAAGKKRRVAVPTPAAER